MQCTAVSHVRFDGSNSLQLIFFLPSWKKRAIHCDPRQLDESIPVMIVGPLSFRTLFKYIAPDRVDY